uniref:Uncharacterized protein n=1 Tax=Arundo donax TaxID=35708 RepID=A0A0A9H822_ARUDO
MHIKPNHISILAHTNILYNAEAHKGGASLWMPQNT